MDEVTIYCRMRHKFNARLHDVINLGRLAYIIAPKEIKQEVLDLPIHRIIPEDNKFVVIDAMDVIQAIYRKFPDSDIQTIGPQQTIIEVESKKHRAGPIFFMLVWLLLFIGAGLTIMNFHEDVSMASVHRKIYFLITGAKNDKPLILQIPYSIGVGAGMILFFNHIFKKRFNEEPSPLEVEMFNYQRDLDQYVVLQENKKSESKRYGD
ncbi:stage V sporulation protein AA [Camelliibacillus cellulosilyticus]|uniref:Stage V sporulation protein AA n=1 Tax=Camelliibacillus cellulosilyticus TaxID=2174486 RepID=A0ABV9GLX1_9BACL